ncbi:hypothetical protein [Azospirillum argentinense]
MPGWISGKFLISQTQKRNLQKPRRSPLSRACWAVLMKRVLIHGQKLPSARQIVPTGARLQRSFADRRARNGEAFLHESAAVRSFPRQAIKSYLERRNDLRAYTHSLSMVCLGVGSKYCNGG